MAEHCLFDLLGDDGADFTKVVPDLLDLLRRTHQEFQVTFEFASGNLLLAFFSLLVALANKVKDADFLRTLSVTVDTAIPLLHPVWVPRNLVVDETGTVVLKVDAFTGGVGGEQDANGAPLRVELERSLDCFTLV